MKHLSREELQLDDSLWPQVQVWLDRGDGIAVYENHDLGHPELGHRIYVSYGSHLAQLEVDELPERLPDIGNQINWRYTLIGVYRPEPHKVKFGTLHPDGSVTDQREIKQNDIRACPHFIMMPDHYREDGSCRCDDPDHSEMSEWGYTWDSEARRWS